MRPQTAVHWLIAKLVYAYDVKKALGIELDMDDINSYSEQAKEMEREQIIRARQDGLDNGFSNGSWDSNLYYNETYNK